MNTDDLKTLQMNTDDLKTLELSTPTRDQRYYKPR